MKLFSFIFAWFALSLGSNPVRADDFLLGFNQPWTRYSYSTWLTDNFEVGEISRAFKMAKDNGAKIVRSWIFEGQNPGGFIWVGDRPVGLKPEFLEHLRALINEAHKQGLKLDLTLFDGNVSANLKRSQFTEVQFNWLYNFLNEQFNIGEDFRKMVLPPLFDVLNEPTARETVTHLDLANEINAMTFWVWTNGARFKDGWDGANRFICTYYGFFKGDERVKYLQISASIGWWEGKIILKNQPWPSCVDYFDIHSYNDTGDIPDCAALAQHAHGWGKKIYLGEFGQASKAADDGLQSAVTANYLKNAKACGLDGAWAWSLANRDAADPLLYERNNVPRPALEVFREFSLQRR